MSTNKFNDLRRSRSSSSIPVPTRVSKLPTRNSSQKSGGRATLGRLGLEKKSIDRNMKRSNSNSNLFELQRLSRQGSSSMLRASGLTPLARHAGIKPLGKKSPRSSSVRKDNRPISDKTWQYQQLVKVRNFVSENISNIEYNGIKNGIVLDTFIELIHNLFQLIDSRINITRENYMTEVAVNLNRYHYPTAVKPSLMKAVNTPHSWPAVLAILSWLVDFINEINEVELWTDSLNDIIEKSAFESYSLWNLNLNEAEAKEKVLSEMEQKLEEMFDIKEEGNKNLDKELAHVETTSKGLALKKKNLIEEIESLQSNNDVVVQKCDNYVKEKDALEKDLNANISKYSEKGKTAEEELSTVSKTEENLKSLVATQPHSYAEKMQLSEEIKALQNTQTLKDEKHKQQIELSNICDYKLLNFKQEIESDAYKYNSIINELELFNSEFRCLYIRDNGFASATVKTEFQEAIERIKKFIETITEKVRILQESWNEMVKKNKQLESELVVVRVQLEELSTAEMELVLTMERDEKNYNVEKESLLENLKSTSAKSQEIKDKNLQNLAILQQKYHNRQKSFTKNNDFKDKFKNDAVTFFHNMRANLHVTLDAYQLQMRRVTEELAKFQQRQIKLRSDYIEQLKEKK